MTYNYERAVQELKDLKSALDNALYTIQRDHKTEYLPEGVIRNLAGNVARAVMHMDVHRGMCASSAQAIKLMDQEPKIAGPGGIDTLDYLKLEHKILRDGLKSWTV